MRFCPNCGSQVPDTSKFCTECGEKLAAAPIAPAHAEEHTEPAFEVPAAPVVESVDIPEYKLPAEEPVPAPAEPMWEAPAEEPVPAPAEPVWEAPAEEPAPAPAEPVWQAPVEEPASVPAAPAATATAEKADPVFKQKGPEPKPTKEKKPINKKTVMIGAIAAAVVILAIILIVALGGGADADDPNLGVYNAISSESMGISLGCEGEWIELKAKGKADIFLMGDDYSGKWSLDGDKFVLTQAGDEYEGTLKDGVLTIDFAGITYTYEKEGYTAPAEPGKTDTPATPPAEEVSGAGYWTLLYSEGDEAMDEETVKNLKGLGIEIFLDLKEDGSGIFMFESPETITWKDGTISADGESFAYAIENEQLTCEIYSTKYVFIRGEGSAPDVGAPADPGTEPDDPGEKPLDSEYAWWNGDWYGWWIVQSASGAYESWEDSFWDAYATIEVYDDDTGWMDMWDPDTAYDSPLASMEVYFGAGVSEHGTMRVESGYFMDYEFEHADWGADPGAMGFDIKDMIWIDFEYVDPANPDDTMDIYIFLRPWGTYWDDVYGQSGENWPYDDMMPMYYNEWYKPLIDRGYALPETYQDGLDILGGGSTGSGDVIASADWDDCHIDVVGAESFVDYEGKDAIRVYYDFTNKSDETVYAGSVISLEVTQDEYEQLSTSASWDKLVPEDGNAYLSVRPGVTIRCIAEYSMKLTGGNLVMEFNNFWSEGESLTVEFDPQELPGRPPEREEEFIGDPHWLDGVPESGKVSDYSVTLDHVEIAEGSGFEDVFRVVLNFTNNSDEATAFSWALSYRAFQNGIELASGYPDYEAEIPEDGMIYEEIQPGQSAQMAVCFELRNEQSPVEVEILDFWTGDIVGNVYELVWGD